MTEIERKALALVNEVAQDVRYEPDDFEEERRDVFKALCRAIERHEAFRQEVSDEIVKLGCWPDTVYLGRFIIPKPVDPLVEALEEWIYEHELNDGDAFRAAIEKRGGKIVWGGGVMANCSECSGTGVAERIGGYDRTCDVCRGDGRFPPMTNPKHTSSDPDTQEAIAWANKVIKAKGTSYTPASRNAAAFILASCDRIEALEAENERLTARVAELEAAREPLRILLPLLKCVTLRQAVDAGIHDQLGWSPYALNEGADENAPALAWWKINAISAALKEDTRHD